MGRARPVAGEVPEAELMARYARELGYTGVLVTELTSRPARENRFGELTLLKPVLGVLDLVSRSGTLRRTWRRRRSQ